MNTPKRCHWANTVNPLLRAYHDEEWGKPAHDDIKHFEMLTLEGAQAGLSWEIVLNKREHYRHLFHQFDPSIVAKMTSKDITRLLKNPNIIRNKLKIESTISNAKAFLKVQSEFGTFDHYLWSFVKHKPIKNKLTSSSDYPTRSPLSDLISKDLKKRGFKFVGTTIIYAFLQAQGVINDHLQSCAFRQPVSLKKWSVYMIRCGNHSLYTGIAIDVQKRFQEHTSQGPKCAKYLRGKLPLALVYTSIAGTRSDALKEENRLKSLTKTEKEKLITLL